MEKDLAEKIVEMSQDDSRVDEEFKLYENYSGRGMFGEITHGVVVKDLNSLLSLVIRNADIFCEEVHGVIIPLFHEINDFRIDSLGLSTIVY